MKVSFCHRSRRGPHSPGAFDMPNRFAACGARLSLALAMLACHAAASAEATAEVGVGAANGRVDCVASLPCDHGRTGWKLAAGYRFDSGLELQGSWLGAHGFQGGDTTAAGLAFGGGFDVDAFGFTAGYRWPFAPRWSLTARAGAAVVRTRFDYADAGFDSVRKTQLQPLAALAAAYQVTPALAIGVGLDVTRFKAHDSHGALSVLGAVAQFSF